MSQNKALYAKLKQSFSTDVIIKRSGGGSLKVSDFSSVQAFGNIQSNTLNGRYARLYTNNSFIQQSSTYGVAVTRGQMYLDYEAMDTDAIVSTALDTIASEAVQKNELNSEIVSIKSSSENIQSDLYNLFYNVLNVDFNLYMWIRSMIKYGDMFLQLKMAEDFGIYTATPLSVYEMIREEGLDANNASYVRFIKDPAAVTGGSQNLSNSSVDKDTFENYEIAHFRLLKDTNFLPYGRSHLEGARKIYKQYVLLEDAAILHRISRSAEKRIFYYNIGNLLPDQVEAFMQNNVRAQKKTPLIDPTTGQYNMKYNMMNMLEDYHIPVRGNDNITRIETAKGLEYSGMDDINYFLQKLMSALQTPKAFLNYSDELAGKSTLSGLALQFSTLVENVQKMVITQLYKIAQVHLYVLGYDEADLNNFKISMTTPSILKEQEKIALLKEKVDLCRQMQELNLFPSDWQYAQIFQVSEDQVNMFREQIVEDVKRKFRYKQVETEGNDPAESGVAYGTPSQMMSVSKDASVDSEGLGVPDGYDEKNPVGRPVKYQSTYGTDASPVGRDPFGKKDMKDTYKPEKLKVQTRDNMANESKLFSELTRSMPRKIRLYEQKEQEPTFFSDKILQH